MTDYDICVIGSGAGGGAIAYELALAGHSVVVLEKGPWLKEQHFSKDEIACCRRSVYTPDLKDEQHVIETLDSSGSLNSVATSVSGRSFWNGNCVGGSSNFMSGFFHRMRPVDFKLRSTFGSISGTNCVDWPIAYEELEPYYDKVEKVVGVSGRFQQHANAEPRSKKDYPYPATAEHPISAWIDEACSNLGYHALKVPRAILSRPAMGRNGCEYSGYCGSYGCSSGAKGSSRAALLDQAVKTGFCDVRPHSKVVRVTSDTKGRISAVEYYDRSERKHRVDAKIYVVACQAVETSRLLLFSIGPKFPNGLSNNSGQVGRNLLFSAGGAGAGDLEYRRFSTVKQDQIKTTGPFVNRALDDWYVIRDKKLGRMKGGIVEFLWDHPNAISRGENALRNNDGSLHWGLPLKRNLEAWFRQDRTLSFEVFNDWLPTDDCFVTLDRKVKDKWGTPVAKLRIDAHPHNLEVGAYLASKGESVLSHLGATRIRSHIGREPPPNLMAGGCRFGTDPNESVLDSSCRSHEVENLFVSDGSFMPTGGSVPYTWTIYANSFRVADEIKKQLGSV